MERLQALSVGFREKYVDWAEIDEQLTRWQEAFPHLCRLVTIATTDQGRALRVLVIGPEPDRVRPSVWVDGNMHAQELCGSNVALAIAEDVLAMHLGGDPLALPRPVREAMRDVLFYVLPRMCPDGAEQILKTGAFVRSNPRDRRKTNAAKWKVEDVDGDGLALLMRKVDPAGDLVESRVRPGILVPRAIDDEGPFYKVYPEGRIENFDGRRVPEPAFMCESDVDLNRAFPWSWRPEPTQLGAGSYPLEDPEARGVVAFTSDHPEIFAWLNLHTFGGVYIRPCGDKPDSKMNPSDLALYRQIGEWGERFGGYPMVSGFEEFLYEPDKPLYGDLTDYAYHQRGAIGFVCELWDIFTELGIPRRKPFAEIYDRLSRKDLEALATWDVERNEGRAFVPWKPFEHPQLGAVDIGGVDNRVGLVNPPLTRIAEVCRRQSELFARVAALAPRVLASAAIRETTGGRSIVEVRVENVGYLPTHVLASAKALPWNEPPVVDVFGEEGAEVTLPTAPRTTIEHLDGWGRGLHDPSQSPFFMRSLGSSNVYVAHVAVRGSGRLRVTVRGARFGEVSAKVTIPVLR